MSRATLNIALLLGTITAMGCNTSPSSDAKVGSDNYASAICSNSVRNLVTNKEQLDIGSVEVTQDDTYVCVNFTIDDPEWLLAKTHVAINNNPAKLPQNRRGRPQLRKFPYKHKRINAQTDQICVNYVEKGFSPSEGIYVASHAKVKRQVPHTNGQMRWQRRHAWAEGEDFNCRGWATYFRHELGECAPPEPPKPPELCGYRSQDRDDWGQTCDPAVDADSFGCYRKDNWIAATDYWFEVGCDSNGNGKNTYRIDNQKVVQLHLGDRPAAGIGNDDPRAVNHSESVQYWLSGYNSEPEIYTKLFGDVVALHLNMQYDAKVESFKTAATDHELAELVVADPESPCLGRTVAEVAAEADNVLGGCGSDYTPEEISLCVNAINDAFRDPANNCTSYLTNPIAD